MRRQYFLFSAMLIALFCSLMVNTATAAPLIENINFETGANADRITFKLNSNNLPKTFGLQAPPRAVFDFPNTELRKGVKTNIPVTGNFIKGIRVAEHRGDKAKTRVVLDLISDAAIDFKQDFDQGSTTLVISVFAKGTEPPPVPQPTTGKPVAEPMPAAKEAKPVTPAPPPVPAAKTEKKPEPAAPVEQKPTTPEPTVASIPKPEPVVDQPDDATVIQPLSEVGPQQAAKEGGKPQTLNSIEFDKTGQRGETVNFRLNSFNPPVVFGIEEDSPRIICFFKDTTAGPKLQDTVEAKGRFVKSIQVGKYNNPDNIRVVLDLVPNNNYDLQQIFFKEDNMFMIIINTTGERPPDKGN